MLDEVTWRSITWRQGTKGALKAEFASLRVRVADGPEVRIGRRAGQHLPGDEVWLVGERRASGERKYYLSNLPADTDLKALAAAIKARWVCEQAHQELKEELGLDHFEGRLWTGLHRHALMTLIAFTFLQHQRLAAAGRGKNRRRPSAEPARSAPGRYRPPYASAPAAGAMSPLPTLDHTTPPQAKSAKVVLVGLVDKPRFFGGAIGQIRRNALSRMRLWKPRAWNRAIRRTAAAAWS